MARWASVRLVEKPRTHLSDLALDPGFSQAWARVSDANSILYTTYNGTSWSAWASVPGTSSGQHTRNFLSGFPTAASSQIGLIWTEGTTQNDVMVTSIKVAP